MCSRPARDWNVAMAIEVQANAICIQVLAPFSTVFGGEGLGMRGHENRSSRDTPTNASYLSFGLIGHSLVTRNWVCCLAVTVAYWVRGVWRTRALMSLGKSIRSCLKFPRCYGTRFASVVWFDCKQNGRKELEYFKARCRFVIQSVSLPCCVDLVER